MKQSPEITHELQQVELDIFRAFVDVCEKLDIKYYVIAGTLLGAVRHGGFIPWDDDIDVGIMRKDYEKFIAEAPKLLPCHIFCKRIRPILSFPMFMQSSGTKILRLLNAL